MHRVGTLKRHFQLGAVISMCTLINLVDYCKDGSIPLLTLLRSGTIRPPLYSSPFSSINVSCECDCSQLQGIDELRIPISEVKSSDQGQYQDDDSGAKREKVQFNPQPVPSELNELVPMKILKKNVNLDKEKGLRYLDHASLSRYYLCEPSKLLLLPQANYTEKQCRERTFLNQQSPIVALISFHGSGNTWVRHLVEQATGVFTGSIYCDPGLKTAFPGESVVSGNVIIIKTHRSDSVELPGDIRMFTGKVYYDKAILIVRNPYDALVSEANRRWNSKLSFNHHIGLADETAFISK